jgi:hypothetical protein
MSNKRNTRRRGQRVRSEVNRKPGKVTKAMEAFITAQPAERDRKAEVRLRKASRRAWDKAVNRYRFLGKPRKRVRFDKPRRVYGNTYRTHSLDM